MNKDWTLYIGMEQCNKKSTTLIKGGVKKKRPPLGGGRCHAFSSVFYPNQNSRSIQSRTAAMTLFWKT